MDMKQATVQQIKEIGPTVGGVVGASAAWSLSDIAAGASIFAAVCTAICMLAAAWLSIQKARRLPKRYDTNPEILSKKPK